MFFEDTFSVTSLFNRHIHSSFPNLFITMFVCVELQNILRLKMLLRLPVEQCYGWNPWVDNALHHKVPLLEHLKFPIYLNKQI